jgi:hypothetical protein
MSKGARTLIAAPILAAAVLGMTLARPGVAAASTVAALWKMNETSGTTMMDSSGHGNNGTLHNVALGATGRYGKAYAFNGTSSYVSVPSSASLNPGSANITISFWLKTTHLPASGDYDLVRKGAYPSQNYKVELLPTGQIDCTFTGSSSARDVTGGSGVNNGAWHHIQCAKTSSQINLVVDGKVKIASATIGSIANGTEADIGVHPDGGDWYNGALDVVRIAIG